MFVCIFTHIEKVNVVLESHLGGIHNLLSILLLFLPHLLYFFLQVIHSAVEAQTHAAWSKIMLLLLLASAAKADRFENGLGGLHVHQVFIV